MGTWDDVVVDGAGLNALVGVLAAQGWRTLGPLVRDGAVTHGDVAGTDDLPVGWHDRQGPGRYELEHGDDDAVFSWAVGAASWKSTFLVPEEPLWRSTVEGTSVSIRRAEPTSGALAIIGARPCEVRALQTLDRVLTGGDHVDGRYAARRRHTFVVVAECGAPADTCFCDSMGSGPGIADGFDLSVTELLDGAHRFYVRVGTQAGADALAGVDVRVATLDDRHARALVLEHAVAAMGRRLDTDGLAELLARNLRHPRWDEVAERCVSCGNCTLVCPTCFCTDVRDTTDLTGASERRRRWASCFDVDHSLLHGGVVRPDTASRYRQWLTHKLSTWWDQFGESGCVGCGRCIAWCPVGIDLTVEAAAIRASDHATAIEPERSA